MNVLIVLFGVLVFKSGDVTAYVSNETATGSRLVSVTMGAVPAGAVVGGSVGGHKTYVASCQRLKDYVWIPCQYIPHLKKAIAGGNKGVYFTGGGVVILGTQVMTGDSVRVLTNNGDGGKFEWVPFRQYPNETPKNRYSSFPSNAYRVQYPYNEPLILGVVQRSDINVPGDRLIASVQISGYDTYKSRFTDLNDNSDYIIGNSRNYDVLVFVSTTTTAMPTTIPTIKTTARSTTIPTIKTTARPAIIPTTHAKITTEGVFDFLSDVNAVTYTASCEDYKGPAPSVTVTGIPCQRWDIQAPHVHNLLKDDSASGNQCRDPDRTSKLWCYTSDPNKRWDYCKHSGLCGARPLCRAFKGISKTRTAGGIECQPWVAMTPHYHEQASKDKNGVLQGAGNMCRDADGSGGLWCFTSDPAIRWKYCYDTLAEQPCEG